MHPTHSGRRSFPDIRPIREAQSILGNVSRRTVERLINDGKLQSVKIGRRRMIYADSIAKLIGAGAEDSAHAQVSDLL
jgi:excisionase family DNA binding protein